MARMGSDGYVMKPYETTAITPLFNPSPEGGTVSPLEDPRIIRQLSN